MKHWVFDLDGTLVDSFSHFFSSLSEIFDSRGKKFSKDLYHAGLTQPLVEFFEHHLGKESVPAAMTELQKHSNQDALQIETFEGILPIIQQLKENGARIMEYFGCAADSVTMVGDHEHDVTAAKSIGARAVRASWHSYWPVDPCDHADHQFHRVSEFNRWIEGTRS